MKLGVFLNQYYTPEGNFEVTDLLEQAQLVESLGFDGVSLGERHVHEDGIAEPLTTLAALAASTERLELSTMVMLPALYDPIHLAEQVAAIDRLSGGRLRFGAAIGYRERELTPFGVSLADRVPMFLESLSLLERLWSEERVTHDGEYWQFDDVVVSPRPRARIPIWIGGHADVAIRRAAYRGDAWIASASSTPADLERQIDRYEGFLEEFGMDRADNQVVLMRDCFVADSLAEARETIEPHLLRLYELYARWGQTYMDEHDLEVDYDELAEKFVLGAPTTCIEALRTYEDLGVDQVFLRVQFPGQSQETTLECLERLGDDVIPVFT